MKIVKVRDVKTPVRGTEKSAGIDFFIPNDFDTQWLNSGKSKNIPAGIHVKVPPGYALVNMNKSGVSLKKSLQVGACVVDEDYQGEIHLHLHNIGKNRTLLKAGDKILQALLVPVFYDDIEEHHTHLRKSKDETDFGFKTRVAKEMYGVESERGEGGFGSTGDN